MARKYQHTTSIEIIVAGNGFEVLVDVEYTCRPGTLGSYMEPGDAPEIEIQSATLQACPGLIEKEQPAQDWLMNYLANSEELFQELGDACEWGVEYPDEP